MKNRHKKFSLGVTLIELIVAIVIIGVAVAGVLKVLEMANRSSVDPLIHKQALAIAESMLTEIQQMPFTYCDPDDANAATATSTAGCASTAQDPTPSSTSDLIGPFPNTESRYSIANSFDNVSDYGGFAMPGGACSSICKPGDATALPGLASYSLTVTIKRVGAAAPFASLPLDAALKISVRVTGPANTTITLTGYRLRYVPNT